MSSGDHHHDHGHGHDHHDHDHPHPGVRKDHDDTLTHYKAMEIAVRELLIEKGIITNDDVRAAIELIDGRTPELGAKVVARAWTDPAFKARLLDDGSKAVAELGVNVAVMKLLVVENTEKLHNVIVCTLCSCYPRMLLGRPPDWYKSRNYRSRTVNEPRAVLREFGTVLPDDVEVRVHDSTADMRYLVLPRRPAGTEGWDEAKLAALVTRDSMIGVALAQEP
ncbi:MAG: nitrile hydratase subunit alpha [Alphaproteobacteria bacterium]|nr:nitrile hydratase subunit alpha [Alphaproteobacteria bacterium]